jgi:DNA-3-methyladenine glycosylase II
LVNPHGITLDNLNLLKAVGRLSQKDKDLGGIVKNLGPPPLWPRKPGFATLVYIILEQQVSLASAKAAFKKLERKIQPVNPKNFLQLTDAELKAIGFSRQKIRYCRLLAKAILSGEINLNLVREMDNANAKAYLMSIKGIGNWTSDIYLLMALKRADILPVNDLALGIALKKVKGLDKIPDSEEIASTGEKWKPWRAVATRILWQFYLDGGKVIKADAKGKRKK